MTRADIIALAVDQMGMEDTTPYADGPDLRHVDAYLDREITALTQLLPDGDILTCEDFGYLGETCDWASHHSYVPHVDMKLVRLPDGRNAWLCEDMRIAVLLADMGKTR
jgi:hypothetical protein